jgi:transcriptional regulator with XRE-family HTH domain
MDTEASLTREIASRVRAARESLEPKMTQEEVGAKLGLSKFGYGHYERGTQTFSVWHLYQLARILGRPLEYFFGLPIQDRPDEQTLLRAYRRLDGSVHQARVLIAFLEMCRLWDEAPPTSPAEAKLLPVIVAQQMPDGRLQLVRQGLMDVIPPPDLSDYEPVDGQPLTEIEWELVNCLRQMSPEELKDFERELQARVSHRSASQS